MTDLSSYLSGHDLIWNELLPTKWTDGPFMGNGLLGTIIYISPDGSALHFEAGNSSVEDHRKDADHPEVAYSRERMPIGMFKLITRGRIVGGNMRLHLHTAVTTGHIITEIGKLQFKCYVHSEVPVVICEITATEGEESPNWVFAPRRAVSPRHEFGLRQKEPRWTKPDYVDNPPYKIGAIGAISFCQQMYLQGGETITAWKQEGAPPKTTFFFTCAHEYPEPTAMKAAKSAIDTAVELGNKGLLTTHTEWWHEFYGRSFVSIPDAKLESYYWIQMYKLASATRADRPIIDDSGPWHEENPWAYLTWDLNVQMTYWPIYPANHLDLGMSLVNGLYKNRDHLRMNLKPSYREDSYGLPINSGSDLVGPAGCPGENGFRGLTSSLPWTSHNLWLHYRHTMDDDLLRERIFPLIRGAIVYYFHFLKKEKDRCYHLPKTNSPEYGNTRDCNMDLALIRWGCGVLLESCTRLGIDDPMIPQWRDMIDNLAPFSVDENGMSVGRDATLDKSHRHFSHLLAIYPLYLINADQDDGEEFIRKSLAFWLSREEPQGQYTYVGSRSKASRFHGYSYTAAASMYASIGDGDAALEFVEKAFEVFPQCFVSNGLYLEYGIRFVNPEGTVRSYGSMGPTAETALCVATNIQDMLIQSWGGKVRVFPAVPTKWSDISFKNLSAEGGFLVSAIRERGETVFIRIESNKGESLILKHGMLGEVQFHFNKKVRIDELDGNELRIDLLAGECIELLSHESVDPEILPVSTFGPKNFWGEQAMKRIDYPQ